LRLTTRVQSTAFYLGADKKVMSWWRPSYAWAACRGKYGGEDDAEALARAAEAGDVACINAMLDKYPAVVVLHDRPDKIYTSRRDSSEEIHICYGELCIVISILEAQAGAEEEKIAEVEAAREKYAVLSIYALKSAEAVRREG
jgi:hypothetical protein